jgi:hypothetical protein
LRLSRGARDLQFRAWIHTSGHGRPYHINIPLSAGRAQPGTDREVAPKPNIGPGVEDALMKQPECPAQAGSADRIRVLPDEYENAVAGEGH